MFTEYAHQTRTNKIDDRCETSQHRRESEEKSEARVRWEIVSLLSLSLENIGRSVSSLFDNEAMDDTHTHTVLTAEDSLCVIARGLIENGTYAMS